MFQSFDATTSPDQGPPRLKALRAEMAAEGIDGFLVPRSDAHQGEYVATRDDRLAWLTGFTGSAGFAIVLADTAGVFVDGRYRVQVKAQVAPDFTPVNWPETKPGDWLAEHLPEGATVAIDPWLHTLGEIEKLETRLAESGLKLKETDNLIDRIWADQPPRPAKPVSKYPKELAGTGDQTKRCQIAETLQNAGHKAAVLTLPDSICWLLNIRGADIPRIPVTHAFAILDDEGSTQLFSDPEKFATLGPDPDITLAHWDAFEDALTQLQGPVRVDKATAPLAVTRILQAAGIEVAHAQDPCILPKACKNDTEIAGTRAAHLRDAAAMCEFLAWLDAEAPKGGLTEIDVVKKLEGFRRATNALQDISFDTICGAGPHGAIVHYRVTNETSRDIKPGELLLIDSGGQYLDGTTDITRTVVVGKATDRQRADFTRVLQGMIAISRVRFPKGLAGRDLDALARAPLWMAGQDYMHGTGHGVGVFLCVHEGPQRLSRISEVPLEPGMIVSNEPGYYREGEYGIRIENLIVVRAAAPLGDKRDHHDFETLTWVPIDLRLVEANMLAPGERDWLNAYHARIRTLMDGRLSDDAATWLDQATRNV